ncbi:hypothetical protein ACHBGV_05960 [Streptococcus sp. A34]|uniref:hypothetical protein n=1 Tax=Streptococcus sp. A34 TaxID=3373130 RepID=UPI00374D1438
MKNSGKIFWYILPTLLVYYLVPVLIMYSPLDDYTIKGLLINLIIIYQPVFILLVSTIYSIKNGFSWWFPLLQGLFYLPVDALIFPNAEGSEIYVIPYILIGFLGVGVGVLMRKMLGIGKSRNSRKNP